MQTQYAVAGYNIDANVNFRNILAILAEITAIYKIIFFGAKCIKILLYGV